nr:MAG TPA_asm: hypothetical protein [Caudoviricetes sp.]
MCSFYIPTAPTNTIFNKSVPTNLKNHTNTYQQKANVPTSILYINIIF